MFVRNKSIIKRFSTSNHCFWPKYSPLSTILLSTVKKKIIIWIRREICTDQTLFTSENSSKQILRIWIMESILSSNTLIMDWFLQTCHSLHDALTDGLECCGLLWCCISCLDSHSDGTHSLQRIQWWASDGMLHFYKSVQIKKLIYISEGLRVSTFSAHF